MRKAKAVWSEIEDNRLREAVEKLKITNWREISNYVGTRTPTQCCQRYIRVLKPGIRKGTWTKEEDEELRKAVDRHGDTNWSKVSKDVPGRTDLMCRARWKKLEKKGEKKNKSYVPPTVSMNDLQQMPAFPGFIAAGVKPENYGYVPGSKSAFVKYPKKRRGSISSNEEVEESVDREEMVQTEMQYMNPAWLQFQGQMVSQFSPTGSLSLPPLRNLLGDFMYNPMHAYPFVTVPLPRMQPQQVSESRPTEGVSAQSN